jgi:Fe2+ transport system protein B
LLNMMRFLELDTDRSDEETLLRFKTLTNLKKESASMVGMSSTNASTTYKVDFLGNTLNIIDTPGFGNISGVDIDRKHVENIVNELAKNNHINVVLVVINGMNARATFQLQYVLTRIRWLLPKNAVKHIVILYTMTDNYLALKFPEESLAPLLGRDPKFIKKYMLLNPISLMQKTIRYKKSDMMQTARYLQSTFKKARDTLMEMLNDVSDFENVYTKHFPKQLDLSLNIEFRSLQIYWEMRDASEQIQKLTEAQQEMKNTRQTKEAARVDKELDENNKKMISLQTDLDMLLLLGNYSEIGLPQNYTRVLDTKSDLFNMIIDTDEADRNPETKARIAKERNRLMNLGCGIRVFGLTCLYI